MEDIQDQESLLQGAAVDPTAADNLEKTDFDFVLPLWIEILVGALIFFVGLALYRRTKDQSPEEPASTEEVR